MKLPSQKTLLWLCIFALAVDVFSVLTITVLPWNATSGVTWRPDGLTGIVAASVREPAVAAGIRSGDRTDWRTLDSENNYTFTAGTPQKITVWRNGHRIETTVLSARVPVWPPYIVRAIAVLWILGFAVLIVVRAKPTNENKLLALVLICGALESQQQRMALPNVWLSWILQWSIPVFAVAVVVVAIYANQFGAPLSSFRRWIFRIMVAIASLAAVLLSIQEFPLTNPPWPNSIAWPILIGILPLAFALFALGLAVASAPPSEKQRTAWVFAGYGLLVLGVSIGQLDTSFGWVRFVQEVSFAAPPLALTYAALARRMFDVGFFLNRAAVFTAISAAIVAAFVVLEWALAKWFEDASHTTSLALNAALALGVGLSMRFVHGHVDRFIDAIFFRKRHENETALRRFGREAGFISDRTTLLERTRDEVLAHTEATSARILVADELPANDPAVLALQAWHEPLDLNRYQTSIEGDYAFPMAAYGKFVGALICGEKRNAEHYAPDEIDALSTAARGVGLALSDFERGADEQRAIAPVLTEINERLDAISAALATSLGRP